MAMEPSKRKSLFASRTSLVERSSGTAGDADHLAIMSLRTLSPAPSSRMSSRRDSYSTFRSGAESRSSLSCVARETLKDECALQKFIVWAAVKRNACENMTDDDRRECPLFRCRRRFPDHESMLKHLCECEHLSTAEYWCFECMKPERFDDAMCSKRCLNHHSTTKRRKILSLAKNAKNFFSNLGQKTKRPLSKSVLDLEEVPEQSSEEGPCSLFSELPSTEIVEADSIPIEFPRPMAPPRPEAAAIFSNFQPFVAHDEQTISLPELESANNGPFFAPWPQDLCSALDATPSLEECQLRASRPSLQIDTQHMDQFTRTRKVPRRKPVSSSNQSFRSCKPLSHSTSVSSTSSSNSTASTVSHADASSYGGLSHSTSVSSTTTTSSYGVTTPISAWSSATNKFSAGSGMTHITTPVEPFSPAHSDMGVEGSNQRDPCLFDEETSGLCIALAEGSHPTDPDTLFPDGCLFEVPPNKPQPTTTTRDVPATDDAMEDFVFSDVDFTGFGDAANDGFMQTGNSLLPLHDTHNNFTINTSSLTDSGLLSPHQDINSPNNNPCIPALTTSALSVKPELTSPAQLTSSDSTNFTRSGLRPPDHVAQRTAEPNAPGRPFSMSRLAVPTAIPAQHFPAQPSVPPDDGTLTFLSRQNSAASHRSNLSLRSTHSRPASSHSHAPAPPNANVRLPLADPGQAGAPPGGPGAGGAGAGAGSSLALSFGSDGGAVSDFDSPGNPPSSAGPGSGADSGSVPSFSAPTPTSLQLPKVESNRCCDICGYRPKGDPQWFKGSMAKHRKLQHSNAPPKIYKCPYPGCKSAYKNRPDNLRQHQIDKGHFVDDANGRRPSKRKKVA